MDMPKLLITDSSEEMRQILFDNLHNSYQLKICANGSEALEIVRSFHPDILVLDLMLPGLDGITLLQRIHKEGFHPLVLTTSFFYSAYITGALHRLGVAYSMLKPCQWQAIADRLSDLAADLHPVQYPQSDLGSAVSAALLSMNFSTGKDGFRFLQAAIPLYMQDPGQAITKELYVAVGAMYNKSSIQVERSMRSAIEQAWRTGDMSVWRKYFSAPGSALPRPTNTDFISRMATILSQQGYRCA